MARQTSADDSKGSSPIPASLTHIGPNREAVLRAHADIAAITNDTSKTEAQRRNLIKARRAQACGDHFKAIFSVTKTFTLTNADGQWTISATGLAYNPTSGLVELFGVVVLRNGNNVGLDPHQQFINPPLLFPDPSGPAEA